MSNVTAVYEGSIGEIRGNFQKGVWSGAKAAANAAIGHFSYHTGTGVAIVKVAPGLSAAIANKVVGPGVLNFFARQTLAGAMVPFVATGGGFLAATAAVGGACLLEKGLESGAGIVYRAMYPEAGEPKVGQLKTDKGPGPFEVTTCKPRTLARSHTFTTMPIRVQ